ncbi:HAD family hydrolase [Aerococcus urinaeequi]|uniref:HAD family hydrolase n=1 Tax=Aerococcus viridans TaxID=1377 RepID=A0A2N6UCE5_9LACT|nr:MULTISPECIES: HAD family hydrolase [Aerococcus]OFU52242.1 hypothetical protein HMPREF3116_02515 [Aerococcus sp. HMSC10H05]PMC79206.1 HAD family hydrolase [Aerococcus viridans]
MNIKAIGFDLDDTLYDRFDIYRNVFNLIEERYCALNITFDDFNMELQRISIEEYSLFSRGYKDKQTYKIDRVKRTYSYFGRSISNNLAKLFDVLYRFFRNKIMTREKVNEVLCRLKNETNLTIFILTNGPTVDQRDKIEVLQIEQYFPKDKVFISESVGWSKPSREIFKYVEDKLSISNEEILYIGDHYHNDIQAGKNCGWHTVFFNFENTNQPLAADYAVHDFSEFEKLLEKLNIL